MRLPLAVLLSVIVAGCSQPVEQSESYAGAAPDVQMMRPPPPSAPSEERVVAADVSNSTVVQRQPTAPAGVPMLAYSYNYGIEAPPKSIRLLVARHEQACAAAGPTVCQMTSANVQELGEDQIRGSLQLRATPAWLKRFREGVASEARAEGGRVVQSNVTSEDLSRQIVDTEAALRAKSTLRDRLQALLASRPGKLSELLELERELARVQQEIDATQSQLEVMRARVAMSELTISYASAGVLAPQGAFSPIGDALSDVAGIIAGTLAFMIRLVAVLFIWALLIGGLLWVFRKRLPKVRLPRREPPPPAT